MCPYGTTGASGSFKIWASFLEPDGLGTCWICWKSWSQDIQWGVILLMELLSASLHQAASSRAFTRFHCLYDPICCYNLGQASFVGIGSPLHQRKWLSHPPNSFLGGPHSPHSRVAVCRVIFKSALSSVPTSPLHR